MLDPAAYKLIEQFNKNIEWLKKRDQKDTSRWVRAKQIMELTGWTAEKMRTARRNRLIEFKTDGGRFWYNPDSINAHYIKLRAVS